LRGPPPPLEHAKANGADGIIYTNRYENAGSTSYITFSSEQIKSAAGNAGTYSAANLYTLFQAGDRDIVGAGENFVSIAAAAAAAAAALTGGAAAAGENPVRH
jgi:hypothetical protein